MKRRPGWWVLDEDGALVATFPFRWQARRWVRYARGRTGRCAPAFRWQIVAGLSR